MSPFLPFNLALAPLLPALGLYTLHRRFVQKKSAESFAGQWGRVTPEMREFGARDGGPKIWIHAVSVGETVAARVILRALKTQNPNVQIALSSTTDTGHELALAALKAGECDLAFYFPLDLPTVQMRILNALLPDKIALLETELWPNLLHLARSKNIETFLLNGRVSDNLLQTAPKIRPIWNWMSGNVGLFLMRSDFDAARLEKLGVSRAKIMVCGDVKLEAPPVSSDEIRQNWRGKLAMRDDEKLLICGSTHEGEEAQFLPLLSQIPHLKLAFAPRHPHRFEEVAALLNAQNFAFSRASKNETLEKNRVFLLDSMGQLSDFYAAGDLAFVGGSLIQRGGHNLLEPILRGSPTLFGPHVQNFRAQQELILKNGLGAQISAVSTEAIAPFLNPNRSDFARKVEAVLAPHRGAAERMARALLGE